MGFFKEFKEFAIKGNVVDLAVAVVIGGAFGKIVTSLVDDIITPGILTPVLKKANLQNLSELVMHIVQKIRRDLIDGNVVYIKLVPLNKEQ